MVCPNCQADDNVVIQGQKFCLNCGFLIPEKAPKAVEAVATAPQPIKSIKDISIIKPEKDHPKASKPEPSAKSESKPLEKIAPKIAPESIKPEIIKSETIKTSDLQKSQATEESDKPQIKLEKKPLLEHQLSKPTKITIDQPPHATPADQAPIKKPVVANKRIIQPPIHHPEPPKQLIPDGPSLPHVLPVPQSFPHLASTSAAFNVSAISATPTATIGRLVDLVGPIRSNPSALPIAAHAKAGQHSKNPVGKRFGLTATITTAVPVTIWLISKLLQLRVSTPSLTSNYIDYVAKLLVTRNIGVTAGLGLVGFAALAAYGVVAGMAKLWALAALSHGYAKELDERPSEPGDWSKAAWASLPPLTALSALGLLTILPVIAAPAFVVAFASYAFTVPLIALLVKILTILIASWAATAWLSRVVYAAHGVILGALSPLEAWKLGGHLYSSERLRSVAMVMLSAIVVFGMVAAAVLATIIMAVLLRPLADVSVYASSLLFIGIVIAGLAYHYTLIYLVVLWLHQYREAVGRCYPGMLVPLTLGRPTSEARIGQAIVLTASLCLVAIGATILIWLAGGWHWAGAASAQAFWLHWR